MTASRRVDASGEDDPMTRSATRSPAPPGHQEAIQCPPSAWTGADPWELGELLEFLNDWLESDRGSLVASLARFVGNPGYGPDSLPDELARFRFLLGVTHSEDMFTPDKP